MTAEVCTHASRALCLHLSKSGVNWILLYVPGSDYKCKVACTELYTALLWGPPPSLFPSRPGMRALWAGGVWSITHILHPGGFCCRLTWQHGGWEWRESSSGYLCLLLSIRCAAAGGGGGTKQGAIECKMPFFVLTFLQAQPTHSDPWRQDQQKPAPDQKVTYQKPCHRKQAVMAAENVAAVGVFNWALSVAPCLLGLRGITEKTLSGLPGRSGIWSWWLYVSLGWGVAVSASQKALSWSEGVSDRSTVETFFFLQSIDLIICLFIDCLLRHIIVKYMFTKEPNVYLLKIIY